MMSLPTAASSTQARTQPGSAPKKSASGPASESTVLAAGLPMGQLAVYPSAANSLRIDSIGSGLLIIVYDSLQQVSALAHIVLADSQLLATRGGFSATTTEPELPAQFADRAIPVLLEQFEAIGGQRATSTVRMAGGAQLFNFGGGGGNPLNIGSRNAIACRAMFAKQGLRVEKTDVGGNKVRDVLYWLSNGRLLVQSVGGAAPLEL